MNGVKFLSITILLFLCSFAAFTDWQLQDDYVIKFNSRSAKGTIKGLKGVIRFDSTDLPHSKFDVTADVHTLNTGNRLKNKHALGKGFFHADKFPTIGFTSDSIVHAANGYNTYGSLRIKDVTRRVVIPFSFEQQGNKGVFRGNFSIDRKDYHLRRFAVSRQIDIELVIPVHL